MDFGIPPEELQWQLERLHESRFAGLISLVVVVYVLALISLVFRVFARRVMSLPLRYDDFTIMGATVGLTGIFVIYAVGLSPKYGGIGRHVVAVGEKGVTIFLKGLYAFNIIYTLTIPTIKISILLFYHRTFPSKELRRVTYVGIVFFVLLALSTALVDIFNCTPIKASWNKKIPSKCINPPTLYLATAIINLVTDIIILLIPLPLIWRLQMSLRNRIALYGIFLLGGFVCIATALRIPTFNKINMLDITWTYVPVAYFTFLELSLGVVCANLPTLRPLAHLALKDFRSLPSRIRSGKTTFSSSGHNTDSGNSRPTTAKQHKRNKSSRTVGGAKDVAVLEDPRRDLKELEKVMDRMVDRPGRAETRVPARPKVVQRPDSLPYIETPPFEKGVERPFRDSMVSNLKLGTPMADLEKQEVEGEEYFDYDDKPVSLYGSTIRTKDS